MGHTNCCRDDMNIVLKAITVLSIMVVVSGQIHPVVRPMVIRWKCPMVSHLQLSCILTIALSGLIMVIMGAKVRSI